MGAASQQAKAAPFDQAFIDAMVLHYSGVIMMADEALKVTARHQIRTLSHTIVSSQTREIGRMQGILDRRVGR